MPVKSGSWLPLLELQRMVERHGDPAMRRVVHVFVGQIITLDHRIDILEAELEDLKQELSKRKPRK